MWRFFLAALGWLLLPVESFAQTYVWKEGETTYMQSSAPRWYRYGTGPRTQLLVNGAVVDDTAWVNRNPVIYVTREVFVPTPIQSVRPEPSEDEKLIAEAARIRQQGSVGAGLVANELLARARGEKSEWRRAIEKQQDKAEASAATRESMREAIRDCRTNMFAC